MLCKMLLPLLNCPTPTPFLMGRCDSDSDKFIVCTSLLTSPPLPPHSSFPFLTHIHTCVGAIPDLPDGWLHLCDSLLHFRDIGNTTPKGHMYRIHLHASFEQAMTKSPVTRVVCCNRCTAKLKSCTTHAQLSHRVLVMRSLPLLTRHTRVRRSRIYIGTRLGKSGRSV